MKAFNPLAVALVLAASATYTAAGELEDCKVAGGAFLVGTVVAGPTYAKGHFRHGVELSHTQLTLRTDDGADYLVAADNVFAEGYQRDVKAIPSPLNTIGMGDHFEACGIPFDGGMHWVHANCGDTPSSDHPNGWLKRINSDGSVGVNMQGASTYCGIWPRKN